MKLYVSFVQFFPSVRLTLHQYFVLVWLKFPLVVVMFVPLLILVVRWNVAHVAPSVLLLLHVAVMTSLLVSVHTTYSGGVVGHMLVRPLVGASLVRLGALFIVRLYVALVQLQPSVRLTLHQYFMLAVVKLVFVWLMFVPVLIVVLVAKFFHSPELLLRQVAVIVSLSLSLTTMYSVGLGVMLVRPPVGASFATVSYTHLRAHET